MNTPEIQYKNIKDLKDRLVGAREIFSNSNSFKDKLGALRAILKGAHPELDTHLEVLDEEFRKLEVLFGGQVANISIEFLPENTEEEKKRKKAFIAFLNRFNEFRSEITRVQTELAMGDTKDSDGKTHSALSRILSGAKGILGVITVLAFAAVLAANAFAAKITIENKGCDGLEIPSSVPRIPGFSLPAESVKNASYGVATLPPLPVTVDGTASRAVLVNVMGYTASYDLKPSVTDLKWDGMSLLGVVTHINLWEGKEHTLIVMCK